LREDSILARRLPIDAGRHFVAIEQVALVLRWDVDVALRITGISGVSCEKTVRILAQCLDRKNGPGQCSQTGGVNPLPQGPPQLDESNSAYRFKHD
jgi:hypothetical protein